METVATTLEVLTAIAMLALVVAANVALVECIIVLRRVRVLIERSGVALNGLGNQAKYAIEQVRNKSSGLVGVVGIVVQAIVGLLQKDGKKR